MSLYKTNLVRQVDTLRKAHVSSHVVRRACLVYNDNMVLVGPYKLHLTVYSPYYHCTSLEINK